MLQILIILMGILMAAAGFGLTIIEYRGSALPFISVLVSGDHYILLIVGIVIFVLGLFMDLFFEKSGAGSLGPGK